MADADFEKNVLEPAEAAAKYVAETGGLPEIVRASADLREAIDQTGQEIDAAQLASRYSRKPTDYYRVISTELPLAPSAKQAIDEEGEAGLKKLQLKTRLTRIESGLNVLIDELVELRADLHVSQQEL